MKLAHPRSWYILGRSFLQIINFVFLTQLFYFGHSAFCFARLGCPANQKTKNHNLMGVRKSVSWFFYLLFARPLSRRGPLTTLPDRYNS